jgi:glycosidase
VRQIFISLLTFLLPFFAYTQNIDRIDPPFWWIGMKNNQLQLLIHGKNISEFDHIRVDHEGIKIENVTTVKNPNYLFVSVSISDNVMAGKYKFYLKGPKKEINHQYEFKSRKTKKLKNPGINNADFIYLLMPDRFSNGDKYNDKIPGMLDQSLNNDSMFYRHGGDLQGVINHLSYLDSLGVTALWLNPIIENNQPTASYHGYAFTDHYKVDPRLGNKELYIEFINQSHNKEIKIIQDMVYNHVGNEHWLIKDLPDSDWIGPIPTFPLEKIGINSGEGESSKYFQTNYRATTLLDPYASDYDKVKMRNGWFDKHMPDLNQKNPLLATYLIQNSIWWIEYTGIDGYRIDTYAYCDRKFMSELAKSIFREYPHFGMFGEIWDHGTPIQSFFSEGFEDSINTNTNLPGITDFQLYYSLNAALTEPFGWTEGLNRIYYTLCQDYLYKDAFKNVIFLDNHDVSRFYSVINEDLDLFKMGIGFLLTSRGIPMMYYGTENLMKNFANPDGKVRENFIPLPTHAITAYEFIKTLANYRKNNAVLQSGKLKQFVPEDGIYVYCRYNNEKTIMVIMNTNKEAKKLSLQRFSEMFKGFTEGNDIITNEIISLSEIVVKAKNIQILELQ